jgi:hypothetical protein
LQRRDQIKAQYLFTSSQVGIYTQANFMKSYLIKVRFFVFAQSKMAWIKTKSIGAAFKREARETREASKILLKIVNGKEVTKEEIKFLKDQSADLGKALALIGLQAVPGSSVAILAIEKVGQKHGFTLFPQSQSAPNQETKPAAIPPIIRDQN